MHGDNPPRWFSPTSDTPDDTTREIHQPAAEVGRPAEEADEIRPTEEADEIPPETHDVGEDHPGVSQEEGVSGLLTTEAPDLRRSSRHRCPPSRYGQVLEAPGTCGPEEGVV